MPESVVHFQIRMPPQQHEKLATWAKEDKVSLNMLVVGILETAMERHKSEAGSGKHSPSHASK
jgi:predicted HicB family RNase H-like nuclease